MKSRRTINSEEWAVNPYLNTPPTKLRRNIEKEKNPKKKKKMTEALNAWRITTPGPFSLKGVVKELVAISRLLSE